MKTTKEGLKARFNYKGENTFQCYLCDGNAFSETQQKTLEEVFKIIAEFKSIGIFCQKCEKNYYIELLKPIEILGNKYHR